MSASSDGVVESVTLWECPGCGQIMAEPDGECGGLCSTPGLIERPFVDRGALVAQITQALREVAADAPTATIRDEATRAADFIDALFGEGA